MCFGRVPSVRCSGRSDDLTSDDGTAAAVAAATAALAVVAAAGAAAAVLVPAFVVAFVHVQPAGD